MQLGTVSREDLTESFRRDGIRVAVGPFVASIRGNLPELFPGLYECYANYPMCPEDTFADAQIAIEGRRRRLFGSRRPENDCVIRLNNGDVYTQAPSGAALPYTEWGINLCIATRAHRYLMLHAGVVEKDGVAMILPGLPGSGKSTLCAYLMHRGWRLLSDEFTLLTGPDLKVHPFPRLVPLKNESIDVIRTAVPEAVLGPTFAGTPKGTVAHVCPPKDHVERMSETARPKIIIFPDFRRGAEARLVAKSKPQSFVEITKHAFNYILLGRQAFDLTTALIDGAACYRLTYGDLAAAECLIDDEFPALAESAAM